MFVKKNPKVSVITACLNSERYIERAIKELSGQTYKNIEHVIIDGCSTDGTLKILDNHKDIIARVISEPDKGIYDAMNKGIKYSTGEILYFFNSDDRFYSPHVIRDAVESLKRKKVDFVYGDVISAVSDKKEPYLGRYPRIMRKRYFLRNTIAHQSSFFSRRCFEKAGTYDIRYKIIADYEWYIRALYIYGLRCAHTGRIISIFQCGGASTNDTNKDRNLSDKALVQSLYFTPFEAWTGRAINFFYYGDFLRTTARYMFSQRGYNFLLRFKKKAITHG